MTQKYRAWDTTNKEMFKDTFAITESGQVVTVEQGFVTDTPEYVFVDNLVVMQSTGLKDLNGIEIFEGDILEIQGLRMVVKFGSYNYIEPSNSGCGAMDYMYDGLGFYVELINFVFLDGISPFEPETLKESVVIGNRFENPEFLKEV